MKHRIGILGLAVCATAIASCSPGATLPSNASVTVSASATVQPAGGTLAYPSDDGYAASFVYGSNNAPPGVIAKVTTITNPPASLVPMDPPSGTVLIAYELTLNRDVRFSVWNGFISSVEVPVSIDPSGHTFSAYGYDLTLGVASGSDPGVVKGLIVSFPAGRPPVTLRANHEYLMVLAMQ